MRTRDIKWRRNAGGLRCSGSTRETQDIEETGVVIGRLSPKVIVVDEDLAIDLAYRKATPETCVVNCKWHIDQNIDKNLQKSLGPTWEAFQDRLNTVCATLTPGEFEIRWNDSQRYLQGNRLDDNDPDNVDSDEEGCADVDDKGNISPNFTNNHIIGVDLGSLHALQLALRQLKELRNLTIS
ncbi:hypothetical protein BGX26_010106 [Mortierella sp. AD094]|nr:hypothetical protein BGX26_010106 [Mortierella sp. AD094]